MFHSKAVSSIRLIALAMIVACHIFQGENIVLAWWFNVGVQIFLFMSGFIYGTKVIDNPGEYVKKRSQRILVPYYILLLAVTLFYAVFARNLLNLNGFLTNLLVLQGFGTGLAGIEHLWFISYILMCYLVTPVLQAVDISSPKNKKGNYIFKLLLILVGLQIINYAKVINFSIPNFSAYILGYYFSRRHFYYDGYHQNKPDQSMRRSLTGIFTACILTTPLVIYLEYFYNKSLFSPLYPYKDILFAWNHTLLGMSLFLAMYMIFERIYRDKTSRTVEKVLHGSDKYSYSIYLTHQIFILGQFSLLNITPAKFINIILIILCAVISGMGLQKLNRRLPYGS